ncbi:hypothetical protein HY024_01655 [Candidatus Curtissbacteria bacterium]|nr:hypothetical protein [Candidatus Curtissbacteria bacterium]
MKKGAAHLLAIILVLVTIGVIISAKSFASNDSPVGRLLSTLGAGPASVATPPPSSSAVIGSFTPDKNYTGPDQASAQSVNGCLTTGNQKGTGAVRFSWSVSGATGVYVTWSGNLSGRFPTAGTTTAPFVISGFTSGNTYSAVLHAVNGSRETTATNVFVVNNCGAAQPTITSFTIDKNYTGYVIFRADGPTPAPRLLHL